MESRLSIYLKGLATGAIAQMLAILVLHYITVKPPDVIGISTCAVWAFLVSLMIFFKVVKTRQEDKNSEKRTFDPFTRK